MRPLHPVLIDWLDNQEKRDLIARLIRAEGVVGQFGTVTITYVQGHAEKIIAETTIKEKL